MRRSLAAILLVAAACSGTAPAFAQDAQPDGQNAVQQLQTAEYPKETMDVAMRLVKASGTARTFDVILPNVADKAKNAFVKANPQMQLGVIEVVDRIALSLVNRRAELDRNLARIWASGYTQDEMEELIAFFDTDLGKKFAEQSPKVLTVQMAAAQDWARAVGAELTQKVSAELRTTVSAEQEALQRDIAGPALESPAPAQ